ncbi:MAG: hypothetical protein JXR76_08110 [Deltaproteobacteria bacterium]|nr:hypothetical protein [Deltaproteobacteria bacterium]
MFETTGQKSVGAFHETPWYMNLQRAFRETPLRLISVILLSFLLTACFGSTMPDPGPRGTLRFKSNQQDAILEVDETRLGPIGSFEQSGVLLRPGKHRVVVHQNGFFKEYKLVTVVENQLQVVEIHLTQIPN